MSLFRFYSRKGHVAIIGMWGGGNITTIVKISRLLFLVVFG